jgi:hypothetical protein
MSEPEADCADNYELSEPEADCDANRGRTEPATRYQQPDTNQQFRCWYRFRLCYCWLLVWYLVGTEIKDTG